MLFICAVILLHETWLQTESPTKLTPPHRVAHNFFFCISLLLSSLMYEFTCKALCSSCKQAKSKKVFSTQQLQLPLYCCCCYLQYDDKLCSCFVVIMFVCLFVFFFKAPLSLGVAIFLLIFFWCFVLFPVSIVAADDRFVCCWWSHQLTMHILKLDLNKMKIKNLLLSAPDTMQVLHQQLQTKIL